MLWSGHYSLDHSLVLFLGGISCVVVVAFSLRMRINDSEGLPIHLVGRMVFYGPWLIWLILKANIDVALRILNPKMPISPVLTQTKTSQKSALGQVIYANSITLTPGTVSVDVRGDTIIVHSLSSKAAKELEGGQMDRRVTSMEGKA